MQDRWTCWTGRGPRKCYQRLCPKPVLTVSGRSALCLWLTTHPDSSLRPHVMHRCTPTPTSCHCPQVMPFILRRTKAQVLQDLPPKIVTDMLCSLSPIQHALYEDFQESQALSEVRSTLAAAVAAEGGSSAAGGDGGGKGGAQHVFSVLLYLRKLCSHPLLVLDWSVPAHREACQQVLGASTQAAAEVALRGLEHAPKLLALQDILVQCGIIRGGGLGSSSSGNGSGAAAAAAAGESDLSEGSSDSGHRLLVFAQLKGMLDLVESLLLQPLGVSSLRLDGSVDASARFGVVQRFNTDPTIQVCFVGVWSWLLAGGVR